jgi:hypothetical protein
MGVLLAPVGGVARQGRWRVGRRLVVLVGVGGCRLDLREAELAPEARILVAWLAGGVTVVVPASAAVDVTGGVLLGRTRRPTGGGDGPRIALHLLGLAGGAAVERL